MKEEWRTVKDYESYLISNKGNIKSIRKKAGDQNIHKGLNNCGYEIVSLWKNGKRRTFSVHRLVAMMFLSNTERKEEVNHIDNNRSNNNVNNLEWCSHLENIRHSTKSGNKKKSLNVDKVKIIKYLLKRRDDISMTDISKFFNVTLATISYINSGKTWNDIS